MNVVNNYDSELIEGGALCVQVSMWLTIMIQYLLNGGLYAYTYECGQQL